MKKTRASSSDAARIYRATGHKIARDFALAIGMSEDYKRDLKAKKDVIDPSGDAHSVKAGEKKWQIFLYKRNRFETDDGFASLNGVGQLLTSCIDAFPENYYKYQEDKHESKMKLQFPMRELCEKFQNKRLLRSFLRKAMFNGAEVSYLTVFHENTYRIYWCDDIIEIMSNNFEVTNSMARTRDQYDEQKVLFRYHGANVGELEMRNDSFQHYREIRFNMVKLQFMKMIRDAGLSEENLDDISNVVKCGQAIKKFKLKFRI